MESRLLSVVGVVENYVEDNAYARLVQGHNELLEFFYAHAAVLGVGGVVALQAHIVFRVVAPVILPRVGLFFVYGSVIRNRHELNVGNAQLFQMVKAGGDAAAAAALFGKAHESAAVVPLQTAAAVYRKIAHVALVDNGVHGVLTDRAAGILPALGVQRFKIRDVAAVAVHAARLCVNVDSFHPDIMLKFKRICVVKPESVVHKFYIPYAALYLPHAESFDLVVALARGVKVQIRGGAVGRPDLKSGNSVLIHNAEIFARVGVFSVELCVIAIGNVIFKHIYHFQSIIL